MSAARKKSTGPAPFELIEESVHLLRRTPAGALALYYVGTAPFAFGLVMFWARTTWFHPSDESVAWGALGLVVLFALMKTAHANFCARLLAQRIGDAPPKWTIVKCARVAFAQLRVQPWGIILLPMALALTVPFGWVYAYFQSASVIGDGDSLHDDAVEQAKLWTWQNNIALLLLSAVSLAVWINVAAAFLTLPWLANVLLGIDNLFGISGWWFGNSTFVASTFVLTWLALDPLMKAFYVLRVFYGRSRRSGEDLRVELRAAKRARPAWHAATVALILATLLLPAARMRADDTPAPAPIETTEAVQPPELDAAIDRVLEGSDFEWSLRPVPGAEVKEDDAGPIKRFARKAIEGVRDFFKWIGKLWRDLRHWIDSLFPKYRGPVETAPTRETSSFAANLLLWTAIVLVVGLLITVLILAWRRGRVARHASVAARPAPVAAPDLRDDSTQASQLPPEGWLALAHQQIEAGEWRLALRAVYLATLARLAADGLVSLAKFKTNLDYERELRRRALVRQEVVPWFAARRGTFEAVWYGNTPAVEAAVREWLAELERPAQP